MLIEYYCQICDKTFYVPTESVDHSKAKGDYITCPFYGKHSNLKVRGKYDDISELMKELPKLR